MVHYQWCRLRVLTTLKFVYKIKITSYIYRTNNFFVYLMGYHNHPHTDTTYLLGGVDIVCFKFKGSYDFKIRLQN